MGHWPVWLIAMLGLVNFTVASLYAFFGKVGFNFSNLFCLPASWMVALRQIPVALNEEMMFRGLILYILARVWVSSKWGLIRSVVLTSLIFAILHLIQVSQEVTLTSLLLLVLETLIISVWWSVLVLWSGSIWPAVMLHFVVNTVVAVQSLTVAMVEPDIVAYSRILWFSIPLGVRHLASGTSRPVYQCICWVLVA